MSIPKRTLATYDFRKHLSRCVPESIDLSELGSVCMNVCGRRLTPRVQPARQAER